jgi:hypothetical protein
MHTFKFHTTFIHFGGKELGIGDGKEPVFITAVF